MPSITDFGKRAAFARFPFTYPSWNVIQGMHPMVRKKKHDKFQNDVGMMLQALHIEPFKGPVKIFIDVCFKKRRRRDNDNYGGKWLLDAIVKAGIIPDDSTKWIPDAPDIKILDGEPEDHIMLKIEKL